MDHPGTGNQATVRPETGRNILVADDMPLNFLPLEDALALAGCRPVCVRNGQAALDTFLTGSFDLLILDCRMPILDGLTVAQRVRQHEIRCGIKRTPIVMVSASQEERRTAREIGCDDYLEKPLDKNLLLRTLGKHLPIFRGLSVIPASDIRRSVADFPRRGIR